MTTAAPLRVGVVAEFYPRAGDPVLGIWAHRQALAARAAGADVRVIVLHRPVPPRATRLRELGRTLRALRAQPRAAQIDGLPVVYVRFYSPPRGRSYGSWGRWAAGPLGRALRRLHREAPLDLIHAHNAVPAGDAVRRALAGRRRRGHPAAGLGGVPLVVSVHGGDVYYTARRSRSGEAAVRATLTSAALVLANSAGTAERCRALGAAAPRVVRLGTDLPGPDALRAWATERAASGPTLATLAHVVPRKGHADVLRAVAALAARHPTLRYRVIGDGPERPALGRLAAELGIADRVEWRGQLPHDEALRAVRAADLLVMPAVDEAFGVAYVEAMAAGIPAVAAAGEPGPAEIAAAGDGIVLVPPGDVPALTTTLDGLLADPERREALGRAARRTVADAFTWERCGAATVDAYRDAVRAARSADRDPGPSSPGPDA